MVSLNKLEKQLEIARQKQKIRSEVMQIAKRKSEMKKEIFDLRHGGKIKMIKKAYGDLKCSVRSFQEQRRKENGMRGFLQRIADRQNISTSW